MEIPIFTKGFYCCFEGGKARAGGQRSKIDQRMGEMINKDEAKDLSDFILSLPKRDLELVELGCLGEQEVACFKYGRYNGLTIEENDNPNDDSGYLRKKDV